jgi:hypothetical protein
MANIIFRSNHSHHFIRDYTRVPCYTTSVPPPDAALPPRPTKQYGEAQPLRAPVEFCMLTAYLPTGPKCLYIQHRNVNETTSEIPRCSQCPAFLPLTSPTITPPESPDVGPLAGLRPSRLQCLEATSRAGPLREPYRGKDGMVRVPRVRYARDQATRILRA